MANRTKKTTKTVELPDCVSVIRDEAADIDQLNILQTMKERFNPQLAKVSNRLRKIAESMAKAIELEASKGEREAKKAEREAKRVEKLTKQIKAAQEKLDDLQKNG